MLSARELMANNSIPLQGTQAAAHAVQALFGNHNQGTLKSMVMGNRARYALEQARRARDQNIGFSGITPESVQQALHVDPAMAQVLSSELHAKLNPRETTGAMGDMQKNDIRMRALAAVMGQPMPGATAVPDASGAPGSSPGSAPGGVPAGTPDVNLANRLLMVLQGHTAPLSRTADGMEFDPLMTPDAQTMHPTQTGTAMIGERNAQARAADALAALRGQKMRTGSGASKPTLPSVQALYSVLGGKIADNTGAITVDPHQMALFLRWQADKSATDPRYANGNFALQHWPTEGPVGAAGTLPPSGAQGITPPPATPQAPSTGHAPVSYDPSTVARPMSAEQVQALPPGSPYYNPADGKIYIRK